MTQVLNRDKIESKIAQLLEKEGNNLFPVKISKMAAILDYGVIYGIDDSNDFLDEDYSYHYISVVHLRGIMSNSSLTIEPERVYCNPDKSHDAVFEWTPNKDMYIYNKEQYVKLYESFADYLETTEFAKEIDCVGFQLCFYPLYLDEKNTEIENEANLFSKELFDANIAKVYTPEGIF